MKYLVAKKSFGLLLVVLSSLGLTTSASAAEAIGDLEHYVHRLVNDHRVSLGLKALTFNPEMAAIARRHSQDMASGRVAFSHAGLERRGEQIAKSIPHRTAAENIALKKAAPVSGRAAAAVSGWLKSPEHRRNLEGDFDLTGIGIAQDSGGAHFFTQLFVSREGWGIYRSALPKN